MIFVDTGAWFAASVPTDRNHCQADEFLASVDPLVLVTTDYVLDESMTLFKWRGEANRAYQLGRRILEERVCRLVWVEQQDVIKAWITFETHRHKKWSFTDCVSRSIIERLNIAELFAFDDHFREFGNVVLVPQ